MSSWIDSLKAGGGQSFDGGKEGVKLFGDDEATEDSSLEMRPINDDRQQ